jgi:hypothetical protein
MNAVLAMYQLPAPLLPLQLAPQLELQEIVPLHKHILLSRLVSLVLVTAAFSPVSATRIVLIVVTLVLPRVGTTFVLDLLLIFATPHVMEGHLL